MGRKTITFTQKTEQRTYVQGEFTGKYYGTLDQSKGHPSFKFYNIHVYQGAINNLNNEKEHGQLINETIYNSIVSEAQLAQKTFENISIILGSPLGGYNRFRLTINAPKLESIRIYDVVKDGNQTFGTLTCLVSGYLSKDSKSISGIQVETCTKCNQFLEECTCQIPKPFDVPSRSNPENKGVNLPWGNLGLGFLKTLGLIVSTFIFISLGLPGVLFSIFLLFLYTIGTPLAKRFPNPAKGLNWLFFLFIGLMILGALWHIVEKRNESLISSEKSNIPESSADGKNKESENAIILFPTKPQLQNEKEKTSLEQDSPIETNSSNSGLQQRLKSQYVKRSDISGLDSIIQSESINTSSTNSILKESTEKSNHNDLDSRSSRNKSYSTSILKAETQDQTLESITSQKEEKAIEIMSGIEFHEGNVFICNGNSSKRYHFNPNCPGLSNCSTRIYQINIPTALRKGRTLCKLEE